MLLRMESMESRGRNARQYVRSSPGFISTIRAQCGWLQHGTPSFLGFGNRYDTQFVNGATMA